MIVDPYLRKQPWKFRGKGPNGRNLCFCGCGREVNPPRKTCFEEQCIVTYRQHSDPATIRRIVEKRDCGICALCGVDTAKRAALARDLTRLWMWLARREAERLHESGDLKIKAWVEIHDWARADVKRQLAEAGLPNDDLAGHQWEADHIIPVVEGGGGCGPEGYRTLCIPCHKRETAALAARLAAQRRLAKDPLPQLIS